MNHPINTESKPLSEQESIRVSSAIASGQAVTNEYTELTKVGVLRELTRMRQQAKNQSEKLQHV